MAQTTIVPFSTLPSCAAQCGPLYDVNGACVPPAAASADAATYDACFCKDARLAAFSTGTAGVCDSACTANSGGLGSIQAWYTGLCANINQVTTGTATQTSSSNSASASTVTSGGSSSSSTGGSWLSTHWQWVVFIVVMVLGIAGIWIGAAIWRRRYLRRKDRQYKLGKTLAARTNSGMNPYGRSSTSGPAPGNQSQRSIHMPRSSMFMPANLSSANVYDEKPKKEKKKWIVKERT